MVVFYEGFFHVLLGLGLFVYSFIGKMLGHFEKSRSHFIEKYGTLFFRLGGLLFIILGIVKLVSSIKG